jgi:hypothetical protein
MQRRTHTQTRVFDKDEAINFVADAFARAHPIGTAKRIANDVGVSPRSAEKWCAREVAPSLHHFLNACQMVPELKSAMRQLLDMGETDPGFARALQDLVRAVQRGGPKA